MSPPSSTPAPLSVEEPVYPIGIAEDALSTALTDANCSGRKLRIGREYRSFLREVRLAPFQAAVSSQAVKKEGFWPIILGGRTKNVSSRVRGKKGSGTSLTLDMGGWINLPYGVETTVVLAVEYVEEGVPVSFKVDSARSRGATQLLLSGTVDIFSHEQIPSIKIYCYGIDDKSVWIENFQFKILKDDKKSG